MNVNRLFLIFALLWTPFIQGSQQEEDVVICLTIHVKNDEAVIEDCLKSVEMIADCISIYDTESTDETLNIIEKFLIKSGIPGIIYQNSSLKSRTKLIETGRDTLEKLRFNLDRAYILVLEPDTVLSINDSFDKNSLNDDSYLLLEKSSNLGYYFYSARLLKATFPWKSVGAIHEYWTCPEQPKNKKLHAMRVSDQGDEAQRTKKINETIELLQQALEIDPNNQKYIFSLAQSYKSQKKFNDAIQWYQERIKTEEKRDEVWFSKYMIGECYEEMGEWQNALYWFLDAYESNPSRADSLKNISSHYRALGQNEIAYIFAKHGSRVPHPTNQNLYNISPLLDYQFDQELTIVSYYTHFRNEGYAAASDLLLRKGVPWQIKNQTYSNILYYIKNLEEATFQPIEIDRPLIQRGFEDRYHPMNPSIVKTKKGYALICRTVNYTQSGAKMYHTLDETGVFRTRNFLINYDPNFNILSQQEIIENLPRKKFPAFNIEGLEDCRLFQMGQDLWFTCTTTDTSPYNYQISLCKLANGRTSSDIFVDKMIPLKGPDPFRCEKNWMPFIKGNQFHVIYSCAPFVIFKPNIETGDCPTILSYESDHDFSSFRGSAAPIEFDDGYLMLVHEVFYVPDYQRCYLHRLVYLDKGFKITKVTKPFTYLHQGIEFCCSMTIDQSGKKLIMPIGIEDNKAYLCFISLEKVRDLLDPLPTLSEAIFE